MIESQLHVAKGFASGIKGTSVWKNEVGGQTFENTNSFPPAIALANSSSAPPTETNGAIYLLNNSRGILDVNIISWMSANTIRYSFSSSPNLSIYAIGDYITFENATKTINNGTFVITNFHDGNDWIEISNPLRLSATDDEGAGSPATATSTISYWDGCTQNSWARFNSTTGLWSSVPPFVGVMCFNTTLGYFMYYNGAEWLSVGTSDLTAVTYTAKVIWSNAELLSGNSTPKLLASAVTGYYIKVVGHSAKHDYKTAAFATSSIMQVITDTATVAQSEVSILNTTVEATRIGSEIAATGTSDTQLIISKALYGKVKTSNPTVGAGSATQYIEYILIKA